VAWKKRVQAEPERHRLRSVIGYRQIHVQGIFEQCVAQICRIAVTGHIGFVQGQTYFVPFMRLHLPCALP
jgi:hypothetical protein